MIELVVALAIFGITIVGFVGNLLSSMRNTRLSEEISDATGLAQDELDAEPGTSGVDPNPLLGIFNRTWTVTPNTPVNGARTVSVTVSWRDAGNRSITLQSILTPH